MRFDKLLLTYQQEAILDIKSVSLVFKEPLNKVSVQFSRWVRAKKLVKLRQGLVVFSDEYRKYPISYYYLSSVLLQPSYISMEKALEFYGLIPENIYVYTALTTKRAYTFTNTLGTFQYRHIQKALFTGYRTITENGETYYMATPEKALLDYIYVNRHVVSAEFIAEMRLQNLEVLNPKVFKKTASLFANTTLQKAADLVLAQLDTSNKGQKTL